MSPQGKNFVGDLLTDGKIRWVETGQIFNSPSAWATHCKRLVNPAKKSGCGWASVRYRGQKLAQYKTTWLHKYQPSADMVRPAGWRIRSCSCVRFYASPIDKKGPVTAESGERRGRGRGRGGREDSRAGG